MAKKQPPVEYIAHTTYLSCSWPLRRVAWLKEQIGVVARKEKDDDGTRAKSHPTISGSRGSVGASAPSSTPAGVTRLLMQRIFRR